MAVLTTAKRKRLRDSSFADPDRRLLPINDAAHVRAALARFSATSWKSMAEMKQAAKRIVKAAKRHKVELSPTSHVAKVVGDGVSGQRRVRKRTNPSKPNPELAKARRMSEEFHGTPSEVIVLSEKERRLPRYLVALGSVPELSYEPGKGSKRSGYRWEHESGDRGPLQPKGKRRPVLAVDPETRRPVIVMDKSPMRFHPRKGLMG